MNRHGLTLIEAVIVIVIIGVLAILAVPRFSHADSEPNDFNPRPALVTFRTAIEMYYYDHGAYPGQQPDGINPPGSPEAVCLQLTGFTNAAGRTATERTAEFRFGPYLRDGIPACPVPPHEGNATLTTTTDAPGFQESVDAGWIYNCRTGAISLNSSECDPTGLCYDRY